MKTSGAMTDHETTAFRRRTGFGSRRLGRGSCVRRTPRARHATCSPPPFPAGAAPVTRAAWVASGLDAIAASGRVPSPEAGSETHGLASTGFMSSPSPSGLALRAFHRFSESQRFGFGRFTRLAQPAVLAGGCSTVSPNNRNAEP